MIVYLLESTIPFTGVWYNEGIFSTKKNAEKARSKLLKLYKTQEKRLETDITCFDIVSFIVDEYDV